MQAMEVLRVRGLRRGALLAFSQPRGGELLHQRMQVEARVVLAQQRLVGERAEHRQRRAGDGAGGRGRESAAKDRQPRQRVALDRRQQSPRLLEDSLDARVPRRMRGVRRAQQFGAPPQLGGDRVARQHARPRRRELERQRQAFDLAADVDDGRRVRRRQQRGLDALRRLDEQARRVEGLDVVLRRRARGTAARRAGAAIRRRSPAARAT